MKVSELLSPSDAMVETRAFEKVRLLKELSTRAASKLHLSPDLVCRAVLGREKLGSTGMGAGLAMPHARVPGLEKPFGTLVRLEKPIDFDAIDGQPVDVVFLLLSGDTTVDQQLGALACAARRLRDPKVISNLRHANSDAEVYRAVTADDEAPQSPG